ncbi:MAG: hypothetical protein Q4B03_10250 [Lachnospiraceae bacterium]|nr:hypothetical protein [Lachnospiraceae bacterium]
MDTNTPKKGKAGRIIGSILALILIFAAAFFLLNLIRNAYPLSDSDTSSSVSNEDQTDDAAEEETAEDLNETLQTEEEAVPDDTGVTETAEPAAGEETSPTYTETQPETEDGSGAAGLRMMDETLLALPSENGWYRDDLNIWYSPDGQYYYYNGWLTLEDRIYHFDNAGMIDRGWKTIAGQEYYFDENGIYDPNAIRE